MRRWKLPIVLGLILAALPACRTGSAHGLQHILLVTPDAAHAESFRAFFAEEGISCDAVGYDAVTAEMADAHDLVIADAPESEAALLNQSVHKSLRQFPPTKRPVLGISYWGCQVLIRQGAALGNGYT